MAEVLMKALSFVAIIVLGYSLKHIGFFREEDFRLLSGIVLKITLPASIICNFADADVSPSMLFLTALGFLGGVLYIALGQLLGRREGRDGQAFCTLNLSGYNIGNFTLPFVQSFLGAAGVVAVSLFDTGNAFICLGGSYSVARMTRDGKRGASLLPILRTLSKSVPFDTYLIMIALSFLNLTLPAPVLSIANIAGNANAFLSMLMIGVGFRLSGDKKQLRTIARMLAVRYSVALALALGFYFLLPVALEYRQTLVILAFSPIASAAPAFTADLKGDFGLASAINSISIVISIILITIALVTVL